MNAPFVGELEQIKGPLLLRCTDARKGLRYRLLAGPREGLELRPVLSKEALQGHLPAPCDLDGRVHHLTSRPGHAAECDECLGRYRGSHTNFQRSCVVSFCEYVNKV